MVVALLVSLVHARCGAVAATATLHTAFTRINRLLWDMFAIPCTSPEAQLALLTPAPICLLRGTMRAAGQTAAVQHHTRTAWQGAARRMLRVQSEEPSSAVISTAPCSGHNTSEHVQAGTRIRTSATVSTSQHMTHGHGAAADLLHARQLARAPPESPPARQLAQASPEPPPESNSSPTTMAGMPGTVSPQVTLNELVGGPSQP